MTQDNITKSIARIERVDDTTVLIHGTATKRGMEHYVKYSNADEDTFNRSQSYHPVIEYWEDDDLYNEPYWLNEFGDYLSVIQVEKEIVDSIISEHKQMLADKQ